MFESGIYVERFNLIPIRHFVPLVSTTSGLSVLKGMVDPGESISATLLLEFGDDAMNSLKADELNLRNASKKIDAFFSGGFEVG